MNVSGNNWSTNGCISTKNLYFLKLEKAQNHDAIINSSSRTSIYNNATSFAIGQKDETSEGEYTDIFTGTTYLSADLNYYDQRVQNGSIIATPYPFLYDRPTISYENATILLLAIADFGVTIDPNSSNERNISMQNLYLSNFTRVIIEESLYQRRYCFSPIDQSETIPTLVRKNIGEEFSYEDIMTHTNYTSVEGCSQGLIKNNQLSIMNLAPVISNLQYISMEEYRLLRKSKMGIIIAATNEQKEIAKDIKEHVKSLSSE